MTYEKLDLTLWDGYGAHNGLSTTALELHGDNTIAACSSCARTFRLSRLGPRLSRSSSVGEA